MTILYCNSCVYSQPIFVIYGTYILQEMCNWMMYTGGLTTQSSSCKFPTVNMCKIIIKLVESRQNYCNEKMVQFILVLSVYVS